MTAGDNEHERAESMWKPCVDWPASPWAGAGTARAASGMGVRLHLGSGAQQGL